MIVVNVHRIHDGDMSDLGGGVERDFFFLEYDDPVGVAELIRDLVTTRLLKKYGLQSHDIQVLSLMYRGELGVGHFNQILQLVLTTGVQGVERGARSLRVGDKVMQIRSVYDKDVWNADSGVIDSIDVDGDVLHVRFDDRTIEYGIDEL